MEAKDPYESVLVGYFCQAVGWLQRDVAAEDNAKDRLLNAINLSHNPLDPAVGDLILSLDGTDKLPAEFYIFELKVSWHDGVLDERKKFTVKHDGEALDVTYVTNLLKNFPKAATAHFYGALLPRKPEVGVLKKLSSHPYWDVVTTSKKVVPHSILFHLFSIVTGARNGQGMNFNELTKYVIELNKQAASGGRASTGSLRFAFACKDSQLYAFDMNMFLELRLEREKSMRQERDPEQKDGPSMPRPRPRM